MEAAYLATIRPDALVALKSEVFRNYFLFFVNTSRQDHPDSPHKDTKTIYLRMSDVASLEDMQNVVETETQPFMRYFPTVHIVLMDLMRTVSGAVLGRVMIVSLKGDSVIEMHADEGKYPNKYTRYHIPIYTDDVDFIINDKKCQMQEGEIWAVDNREIHGVRNNVSSERVHLIVDIESL